MMVFHRGGGGFDRGQLTQCNRIDVLGLAMRYGKLKTGNKISSFFQITPKYIYGRLNTFLRHQCSECASYHIDYM